MGRKALHTQEQVFEVADRMAAGGQEVTPTALLQALGGGSLTTIYKHLDAWQTSKKDAPVQAVFEMPDACQRRLKTDTEGMRTFSWTGLHR